MSPEMKKEELEKSKTEPNKEDRWNSAEGGRGKVVQSRDVDLVN
jgi:hypothetical protein